MEQKPEIKAENTDRQKPFVPESFVVPESLERPRFRIRKLMLTDAELDYKAVMPSVDLIQRIRGGVWPTHELTFEENQNYIKEHQLEFEDRKAFAYTVMSPDEKECLGCLYIYPPGRRGEKTKDADADVSFWVSERAYAQGLFPVLHKTINEWLTEWPFKKIAFSNAELPQ